MDREVGLDSTDQDGLPFQVRNLVSSGDLGVNVPLEHILISVPGCEYNPEQYHALIFRSDQVEGSLLVNASGKVIVTGARNLEASYRLLEEFVQHIVRLDIDAEMSGLEVQNIVATAELGIAVNLPAIAVSFPHAEYEPEQFPGVIWRLQDRPVTILIFHSGKVVCAGAKSLKSIDRAFSQLQASLEHL